jgi:exoribonuclease-2
MASRIGPGDLVGLLDQRGPQLALVREIRGTRADLFVGKDAKSTLLPLRQLRLIWSGAEVLPSAEELAAALPPRRELASAWVLLQADGGNQGLAELTDLVCGRDGRNERAALWLWLEGGQLLFRWRHDGMEPRPAQELRQLRHQRRRQQLVQEARHRWHELLRLRLPIQADQLGVAERAELELLRARAGGDEREALPVELRRALQVARCDATPGSLRHLLVDLGQWSRHMLPSLEESSWQQGFSAELEALAANLVASAGEPQPGDERRSDRTALHTVTIDDDDTLDIDDGLSLEEGPSGPRLWIHVADPGRLVPEGSPLDLEARRRGTSLYLAQGNLPMFPVALAHGPLSLRSGERCAAWSVWVDLDADGAVAAHGLERSWVKPAYRLSYADADELIELAPPQERALLEVHELLARRRAWRLARGALALDQAEGRIRCRAAGNPEPEPAPELEVVEPGPARLMVAEAMILAGAVVAEHASGHGLALPFRSQAAAPLPSAAELEALPVGPVRHAAIRRCLSRGHVGVRPAPHFSLGLEAYVQATSPIRRYGDLLVQRQLAALLEGREPLTESDVDALVNDLDGPVRQAIQISRDDQRHWQQVWFEQHRQVEWRGVFLRWLRQQDGLALVHLEDLAMDLPAACPARSEPGDALLVRVRDVDPLRDLLRLQAVG